MHNSVHMCSILVRYRFMRCWNPRYTNRIFWIDKDWHDCIPSRFSYSNHFWINWKLPFLRDQPWLLIHSWRSLQLCIYHCARLDWASWAHLYNWNLVSGHVQFIRWKMQYWICLWCSDIRSRFMFIRKRWFDYWHLHTGSGRSLNTAIWHFRDRNIRQYCRLFEYFNGLALFQSGIQWPLPIYFFRYRAYQRLRPFDWR